MLIDGGHGLIVDIGLCLDEDGQSRTWATERLSTIIALGHLERSKVGVGSLLLLGSSDLGDVGAQVRPGAPVMGKAPAVKIKEELVLRAILVVPSPDLDLALWNSVVADEEDDDRER